MTNPRLILTQGLPGSGKSTEARRWVAERPPGERAYIDRDDLRIMLHNRWGLLSGPEENAVTLAQHAAIRSLLSAGIGVVVADTFLRQDRIDPVLAIARDCDAVVAYIDLRATPVGVCIERDWKRGASGGRCVGEVVIRDMATRYGLPTP